MLINTYTVRLSKSQALTKVAFSSVSRKSLYALAVVAGTQKLPLYFIKLSLYFEMHKILNLSVHYNYPLVFCTLNSSGGFWTLLEFKFVFAVQVFTKIF